MAADPSPPQLTGQQLAFYNALLERDADLASWYLGARYALQKTANPEALVHAAHSIRLLMNDLHTIGALAPQASAGNLTDRFNAMREKWEKGKRNSNCYSEGGGWNGEIDGHARRSFEEVDAAISWHIANRPAWEERHRTTIRVLDVSGRAMPGWIEDEYVRHWNTLRDYFVKVAKHHHTDWNEFGAALDALERFVLERLKPRTYSEFAELDAVIAKAEGRA